MKIPPCSRLVWADLYSAAAAFREIACWNWMSDSQVFGVQNPDTQEIGYCCVLGELGEVFGLVVYLGTAGLEQHSEIQSGKIQAGSPEFARSQNCLTAWFGDRNELDKTDIKVVKGLGLAYRGSNAWPQFRCFRPGYCLWYLTETEARYLTLCLQQAREVALCVQQDPDWLTPPARNHYLVRVSSATSEPTTEASELSKASPGLRDPLNSSPRQQLLFESPDQEPRLRWRNEWLKPAPLAKAKIVPFQLDEIRLERIKKIGPIQEVIWEIDAFSTPDPVLGDDRPFYPYSLLCVDHASGFILSTLVAEPQTWQTEFPKTLLDTIEDCKFVPRILSTRKDDLRELFEPLAARLGIEVQLNKKLPSLDQAKRGLLKFLKKQR
jgi:hypothetical protein